MRTLQRWWSETHAPGIELFRHYLSDFLHIEALGGKEGAKLLLVGALPFVAQVFFLVILPVRRKYQHLAAMPSAEAFRNAAIADELWLITLLTAVVGLLISLRWRSLLPDAHDRRLLAGLPLAPRQVFAAKGFALLAAAGLCFVVLNTMPGVLFPALTSGPYALPASLQHRIAAHLVACGVGTACILFSLPAMQGLIAHAAPARLRARTGDVVRGLFVAMMLAAVVLSFSASPATIKRAQDSGWSDIVPFFWFLAIYQQFCGIGDAAEVASLAARAWQMLGGCLGLTVIAWLSELSRYMTSFDAIERVKRPRWDVARLLWRHPVQQAIAGFALQTLRSSGRQQTVWIGYAAGCLALLLSAASRPSTSDLELLVLSHLFSAMAILLAARQVFSSPVDLRANWIFQLHRQELQNHVVAVIPKIVLLPIAVFGFLLPLPIVLQYHGWTGLLESVLLLVVITAVGQLVFVNWAKVPFACSACPARIAPWIRVAQFFVGVTGLSLAADGLTWLVRRPLLGVLTTCLVVVATIAVAGWRARTLAQSDLQFEEWPEAPLEQLGLR